MYCLKCGKETTEKQVFCEDCLNVMQEYPIPAGTAVQIPKREQLPQEKKQPARRQEPSVAEQAHQLRSAIRWLAAAVAVLSVLLLSTAAMLLHTMDQQSAPNSIGRNYTTAASGRRP